MIKKLIGLADFLDSKGLSKQANYVDKIIKSAADDFDSEEKENEPLRVYVGEPLKV